MTLSYGELTLHFGRRLPYQNPSMAGEKKGQWIFGTRGTGWVLMTPENVIRSGKTTDEAGETQAQALVNTNLVEFGVTLPRGGAVLAFANGCRLSVIPTRDDDRYDLPYWELITSEDRVISIGPPARRR